MEGKFSADTLLYFTHIVLSSNYRQWIRQLWVTYDGVTWGGQICHILSVKMKSANTGFVFYQYEIQLVKSSGYSERLTINLRGILSYKFC
jgi:hypothetical protein